MANESTVSANGLNLGVKFAVEQGQKFFPITHRKAIMGLSANTLTLSQSLEIDVSSADNTITINPVVQTEINKINSTINTLESTVKREINAQIDNLWTKVNAMNYALSTSPGGPANTALKLNSPFKLTVGGDATGSVDIDGSSNVTLNLEVSKTKNNYAAALVDGGAAISASRLTAAREIAIVGDMVGSASFDGSGDISIQVTENHVHNEYSLTSHLHDDRYSLLTHTHKYAASSAVGGAATSAVKLQNARTITLTGAITGSGSFDGSTNLSIATTTNHNHAISNITNLQSTLDAKATASHNHDTTYLKLAGGKMTGNLNLGTARIQQNGLTGSIVYVGDNTPSQTTMVWVN